jgi:hypothetical protein
MKIPLRQKICTGRKFIMKITTDKKSVQVENMLENTAYTKKSVQVENMHENTTLDKTSVQVENMHVWFNQLAYFPNNRNLTFFSAVIYH